jgi:hypothetical protein
MTYSKNLTTTYDAVETAIGLSKLDPRSSWGELLRRVSARPKRHGIATQKNADKSQTPTQPTSSHREL